MSCNEMECDGEDPWEDARIDSKIGVKHDIEKYLEDLSKCIEREIWDGLNHGMIFPEESDIRQVQQPTKRLWQEMYNHYQSQAESAYGNHPKPKKFSWNQPDWIPLERENLTKFQRFDYIFKKKMHLEKQKLGLIPHNISFNESIEITDSDSIKSEAFSATSETFNDAQCVESSDEEEVQNEILLNPYASEGNKIKNRSESFVNQERTSTINLTEDVKDCDIKPKDASFQIPNQFNSYKKSESCGYSSRSESYTPSCSSRNTFLEPKSSEEVPCTCGGKPFPKGFRFRGQRQGNRFNRGNRGINRSKLPFRKRVFHDKDCKYFQALMRERHSVRYNNSSRFSDSSSQFSSRFTDNSSRFTDYNSRFTDNTSRFTDNSSRFSDCSSQYSGYTSFTNRKHKSSASTSSAIIESKRMRPTNTLKYEENCIEEQPDFFIDTVGNNTNQINQDDEIFIIDDEDENENKDKENIDPDSTPSKISDSIVIDDDDEIEILKHEDDDVVIIIDESEENCKGTLENIPKVLSQEGDKTCNIEKANSFNSKTNENINDEIQIIEVISEIDLSRDNPQISSNQMKVVKTNETIKEIQTENDTIIIDDLDEPKTQIISSQNPQKNKYDINNSKTIKDLETSITIEDDKTDIETIIICDVEESDKNKPKDFQNLQSDREFNESPESDAVIIVDSESDISAHNSSIRLCESPDKSIKIKDKLLANDLIMIIDSDEPKNLEQDLAKTLHTTTTKKVNVNLTKEENKKLENSDIIILDSHESIAIPSSIKVSCNIETTENLQIIDSKEPETLKSDLPSKIVENIVLGCDFEKSKTSDEKCPKILQNLEVRCSNINEVKKILAVSDSKIQEENKSTVDDSSLENIKIANDLVGECTVVPIEDNTPRILLSENIETEEEPDDLKFKKVDEIEIMDIQEEGVSLPIQDNTPTIPVSENIDSREKLIENLTSKKSTEIVAMDIQEECVAVQIGDNIPRIPLPENIESQEKPVQHLTSKEADKIEVMDTSSLANQAETQDVEEETANFVHETTKEHESISWDLITENIPSNSNSEGPDKNTEEKVSNENASSKESSLDLVNNENLNLENANEQKSKLVLKQKVSLELCVNAKEVPPEENQRVEKSLSGKQNEITSAISTSQHVQDDSVKISKQIIEEIVNTFKNQLEFSSTTSLEISTNMKDTVSSNEKRNPLISKTSPNPSDLIERLKILKTLTNELCKSVLCNELELGSDTTQKSVITCQNNQNVDTSDVVMNEVQNNEENSSNQDDVPIICKNAEQNDEISSSGNPVSSSIGIENVSETVNIVSTSQNSLTNSSEDIVNTNEAEKVSNDASCENMDIDKCDTLTGKVDVLLSSHKNVLDNPENANLKQIENSKQEGSLNETQSKKLSQNLQSEDEYLSLDDESILILDEPTSSKEKVTNSEETEIILICDSEDNADAKKSDSKVVTPKEINDDVIIINDETTDTNKINESSETILIEDEEFFVSGTKRKIKKNYGSPDFSDLFGDENVMTRISSNSENVFPDIILLDDNFAQNPSTSNPRNQKN